MSDAGRDDAAASAANVFETGRVVAERYEILQAIGRGTSGVVYRARDLYVDSGDEIVALKAVHPHLHGDRQMVGRFRREVKILRSIEGPHLCRLLDYVEEDGLLMIAIEHVDGPSLDDYLTDQGSLPLSEVVVIMRQICAALETAHDAGVVHRDLKPSNVLIEGAWAATSDNEPPKSFLNNLCVRVVDFGLAKIVAGDTSGTALTEQDMIFGTPDYMAPEQISGEGLDQRCDVYAAAVMLFEMVVGHVPFDTPGPLTTMAAHLNTPVPVPSETAPTRQIGVALDRCIVNGLSKDPDERYDSAASFAKALESLDDEAHDFDIEDADTDYDKAALGTTLASHEDEEIQRIKKRAQVNVAVRSAAVTSEESRRRHELALEPTIGTGVDERRFWAVLAVVMLMGAVAAGIWLGVRG